MPEEFIEQTMLDIYDQIVIAASNGSKFVNARVDLLMINQTQKEYVLNRIEKKLTDEGYDIQLSYTDENGNLRLGIDFDEPDGIDWDHIANVALLVLFFATFAMSLYTFIKIQGWG
jgi:hypothetical protein